MDETKVTTVQGRQPKILALKGKKQVGAFTSAEKGQLHTVEICINAVGNYIPPMIIFPRIRRKEELMNGAPPGCIDGCTPNGWMTKDVFLVWFQHFVKASGASKQNRVLLILDGHMTHTKNLEVIELARDNGVSIICLPPHCTHRLQPLDVVVMKPFSSFYDQELVKWLRNHPGRVVTTFQVAELFGKAYIRASRAEYAINGFKKTGIFPCNRRVFIEADFAAAEVTERDSYRRTDFPYF